MHFKGGCIGNETLKLGWNENADSLCQYRSASYMKIKNSKSKLSYRFLDFSQVSMQMQIYADFEVWCTILSLIFDLI